MMSYSCYFQGLLQPTDQYNFLMICIPTEVRGGEVTSFYYCLPGTGVLGVPPSLSSLVPDSREKDSHFWLKTREIRNSTQRLYRPRYYKTQNVTLLLTRLSHHSSPCVGFFAAESCN